MKEILLSYLFSSFGFFIIILYKTNQANCFVLTTTTTTKIRNYNNNNNLLLYKSKSSDNSDKPLSSLMKLPDYYSLKETNS